MDVAKLLAKAAAQRERWVDLPSGKRVKIRRPFEVDLPQLADGVRIEHVIDCVCDWQGFAEQDILGASVGASDPLEFHRDLWSIHVRDNAVLLSVVATALAELVTEYLEKKSATEKN